MAEIPIERKKGVPGWLWAVLAAIVLALLLWLILDNDNDEVGPVTDSVEVGAVVNDGTATNETMPAQTAEQAPITELAVLTRASDGTMNGREVDLEGLNVVEMAGDTAFWVEAENGERVYVVLDEQVDRSNNVEGRVNVNAGNTVSLTGIVRDAANGIPEDTAILGDTAAPLPENLERYIYAAVVTKAE